MRKKTDRRTTNLAGAADRGKPGWEERVMESVAESRKRSGRWTDRKNGTLLTYDDPFKFLLRGVAEQRGITMAGYCRRAVAAFIAHDIGVPMTEVTQFMAMPSRYSTGGGGRLVRTQDDGQGFGQWEIDKLRDQPSPE